MQAPIWTRYSLAAGSLSFLVACAPLGMKMEPGHEDLKSRELVEVAQSGRQWTGVAVSQNGRVFVNYPRWSDPVSFSVGEVDPEGNVAPYPDNEWNNWHPDLDPSEHFVCVQAVFVDDEDQLWVLDPANPQFGGVVPGGPKLVRIDLANGNVARVYQFDEDIAPQNSYLNDVRIDTAADYAYITDSGARALIVLDLKSGEARRLLDDHFSTKSEEVKVRIDGKVWRRPDGSLPQVHADGIALTPARNYLYYQALTGETLYRIETRWLRDDSLAPSELAGHVERVASTEPVDGIAFDQVGNLYLSALEDNAVKALAPDGEIVTVVQDDLLDWPDTFAVTKDGEVYVTTSQIHLGPHPEQPYRLFKIIQIPE